MKVVRFPRALLVLAVSLPYLFIHATMSATDFDSRAWQAQRGVALKDNTRARLVPALRHFLRAGMSRNEVRTLLGEPDRATVNADTYQMGIAPYGIDPESYEIRFDNEDRLVEHRLRRE